MTDARYLSRDQLVVHVGRAVTIRRHITRESQRLSVLVGTLLSVGEVGSYGLLPGYLRTDRGDTAVDLSNVLEVTP